MVEFDTNQLLRGGLRLYCDHSLERSPWCGLCEPDEFIALQTSAVSWWLWSYHIFVTIMPAACACRDWTPLLHANVCLLRWILVWELHNRFPFGLLTWWDPSAVRSGVSRQGFKNLLWLLMLADKSICQSKAEMYLERKAVIKAKLLAVWRNFSCMSFCLGRDGDCAGLGVTTPTQHRLALLLCHLRHWTSWLLTAKLQNSGGELKGMASASGVPASWAEGLGLWGRICTTEALVLSRGSRMMFLQEWMLCQPCRAAVLEGAGCACGYWSPCCCLDVGRRESVKPALLLSWGFCLSSVGKEGLSGAVLDYISAVNSLYFPLEMG